MAEEKKVKDEDLKGLMGSDFLMQSVLGKLYAILTTGSEVAPASTDNFFAWATPGYPVTEKYFEFAYLGTSGQTIDPKELQRAVKDYIEALQKTRESTNQESLEIDPERIFAEIKENLQKQAQERRSLSAFDFATLVDFIPDVSGEIQQDAKTDYNEGTLSDAYNTALQMAQVKRIEMTESEKKIVDEIETLLGEKVETVEEKPKQEETPANDDPFAKLLAMAGIGESGEDVSSNAEGEKTVVKKSRYKEAYDKYFAAYTAAAERYNHRLTCEGTFGNLQDRYTWQHDEKIEREKVTAAMRDWKLNGYKDLVENLTSQKSLIEGHSFSRMLENYKDLFEHYRVSHGIREYYDTTLSPADFVESGGWTRFTFSHEDIQKFSGKQYNSNCTTIKTKTGSIFHKTETVNEEEGKSFNLTDYMHSKKFNLSFDFCQVKIVRPWFKESFLYSHYWRLHPGMVSKKDNKDKLSDGENPPKGMLTAYPTSILIIRNLELVFTDGTKVETLTEKYNQNHEKYGGGLRLGWINLKLGASYENADEEFSSTGFGATDISGQSIRVPGLQIIGYNCHVLPKCPDPESAIKEDEWI